MRIFQIAIGILLTLCTSVCAQEIYQMHSLCQASTHGTEQRILNEVKIIINDYVGKIAGTLVAQLDQIKASQQTLEQNYRKLDSDLSQVKSDHVRENAEIRATNQELSNDLTTVSKIIGNLNQSFTNAFGRHKTKMRENQNLIDELNNKVQSIGENFDQNLVEIQDKTVAMDTRMNIKVNETQRTLGEIKGEQNLLNDTVKRVQNDITGQLIELRKKQSDIENSAKINENRSSVLFSRVDSLCDDVRSNAYTVEKKINDSFDQLTGEMSNMKNNYSLIKDKVNSLSLDAEQARTSNTALLTEVNDMKGKQEALELLVDQLNTSMYASDISGLKSTVSSIETQMMSDLSLLRENDTFIIKEITSLLSDFEQARASHTALITEVKDMKGKQEALEQLVDQLNTSMYASDISGLKSSVSIIETQMMSDLSLLRENDTFIIKEITSLLSVSEQARASHTALLTEVKDMKGKQEALELLVDQLNTSMYASDISGLKSTVSSIETQMMSDLSLLRDNDTFIIKEVTSILSDSEQARASHTTLITEVKDLKGKQEALEQLVDQLNTSMYASDISGLKSSVSSIETQMMSDLSLLRENDTFIIKEITSLLSDSEQARASNTALITEVKDMKGKQEDLELLVDQLNTSMYVSDISGLKSSVSSIETQMMSDLSLLRENDTFIIKEITSLLSDSEQARASHTALITDVKDMKGKQEALEQLVDQLNTSMYASDISGLKSSVSSIETQMMSDLSLLRENDTFIIKEITSLLSDSEQARASNTALITEVKDMKGKQEDLELLVDQLNTSMYVSDISGLKSTVSSIETQMMSDLSLLRANDTFIIKEVTSVLSDSEQARASHTALITEVQDMKGKQEALEQLVDQLNTSMYASDISGLKSSVSSIETQMMSDLSLLRENDTFIIKEITSLLSDSEQARASHTALITDVKDMKGKQEALEQLVDQLNTSMYASDISGLKSSVSSIETQMMSDLSLLRENDTFIIKEITSLLSDSEQARASHTALITEVKDMKGKQEALEQLVDQLNTSMYASDISGLMSSVSNMETQITYISNSLNANITNTYNVLNRKMNSAFSGMDLTVANMETKITGLMNDGKRLHTKVANNYNSLNRKFTSIFSGLNSSVSNIQNQMADVKSGGKSLSTKVTNNFNTLNNRITSSTTGLKSSVSSIRNQITGLRNAGTSLSQRLTNNYNTLNSRITKTDNFAKGIGLSCSWTGWENSYDGGLLYIIRKGYIVRGIHSVHSNHYEDRRFEFWVCS